MKKGRHLCKVGRNGQSSVSTLVLPHESRPNMVGYGSMEASNNGNEEAVQLIVSNGDLDLEKFEVFDKEFWKLVR